MTIRYKNCLRFQNILYKTIDYIFCGLLCENSICQFNRNFFFNLILKTIKLIDFKFLKYI